MGGLAVMPLPLPLLELAFAADETDSGGPVLVFNFVFEFDFDCPNNAEFRGMLMGRLCRIPPDVAICAMGGGLFVVLVVFP